MKKKILLLIAVATLGLTAATMAQVPNYVPTNGLVGWWPFNGNANDESGNGNNGTVNGATLTSDRFGNTNNSYSFDSLQTNNIDFGNLVSNFGSSDFTVSLWFTISSSPGYLISKRYDEICTVNNNWWVLSPNGFEICQGGNTGYVNLTSNNYTYVNNTWNLISIVKNSNQFNLYINGILINSVTSNVPFNINNSAKMLSGLVYAPISGTIGKHNGKIDDIGIWNRALSQQEITALYNGNICYQTITVTDTLLINMGITGFNPVTFNNTIKIFPNPTNDHITIDYGNFSSLNGYQVKITNSLGQQMFQTAINQQSNYVSLASWGGNGLYFVYIIDPQGNTLDVRKIVLQ
jgi:hypothetical protein